MDSAAERWNSLVGSKADKKQKAFGLLKTLAKN